MNRTSTLVLLSVVAAVALMFSFKTTENPDTYKHTYTQRINALDKSQQQLLQLIQQSDLHNEADVAKIKEQINATRIQMKSVDFWVRYLEPVMYRRINGPLPVEWETEVFEKFEAPYKREGTGLTQATLYLDEENPTKEHLAYLVQSSIEAINTYKADSITEAFNSYHHFFLCNRLYLLNLAAIYTTGFECPETDNVVKELELMMHDVQEIYTAYNNTYPNTPLTEPYLNLYNKALSFVAAQPKDFAQFDHFTFIKDFISPLYLQNQKYINQYRVYSKSFVDYSLTKNETTIFDKRIYNGQNPKGIFLRADEEGLKELDRVGKLLFYDPILSGNNKRSCVSCHKPNEYFTDTAVATSLDFDPTKKLPRNTPSLINVEYNHLVMMDGKHISLQAQTKDVITNYAEMGGKEQDILEKVMSCNEYSKTFKKLLKYTPTEKEVTLDHIAAAITYYYNKFSTAYSPFDDAMNGKATLDASAQHGFNLFMSKAQCATCHFVPQFNGVKPPFVGSEFEVLGVPGDKLYASLSKDRGRYEVHKADETMNAFRTGSIRNSDYTKPYMHNGVFTTMEEVVDFYDAGGGAGHGLTVSNQTLSADSLKLTKAEKKDLLKFISSLNERIIFDEAPKALPTSKNKALNTRKIGGEY